MSALKRTTSSIWSVPDWSLGKSRKPLVNRMSLTLTKSSYRPKDPATFTIGDIVEVQVSFAAFQTRGGGGNGLELVLCGVTLLSDRFSKVRLFPLSVVIPASDITRPREYCK